MKKVKSSAIYYALFLSVIFALILGGMVLFSGYNQRFSLEMDVEEILIDNAKSGVAYGQANFNELKNNEPQRFRLFGEGVDSVEIQKKQWGAFTIIQSIARHKNKTQTKVGFFGGSNSQNQIPNLYLADRGRPISLCGNTRIEGRCFLPKSGLKRAYIEGKTYQGSKMIYGSAELSEKQLPGMNASFIEGLKSVSASIEPWNPRVDSVSNSFFGEARHFIADDFVELDGNVISGQIIIEARDSIFIGRDAIIENAVLKSKVVYIESGFTGTVQIFASERLVLGENVQLKYPSVLGLTETEYPTLTGAEIRIGEGSQVIGGIFLISEKSNFRLLPTLSIAVNAEVDGLIYCSGKAQIKGTIKGSLYAEKLFLKTASSAYENHLLDGQILDQLPSNFVAPNMLAETTHLKHIAWLE